ncbi:unnamed protein product [Protopolystoma xenopodis]|uniref:Uncharacterized protein n=1 Tax=Protopolystoma xenopodis TaxID=117903 RepID=A0A3S5B735_9PLAT|nr:unnamed protein product [Protopolystoma xenopodis]
MEGGTTHRLEVAPLLDNHEVFPAKDGVIFCLPSQWVCDGFVDCKVGSLKFAFDFTLLYALYIFYFTSYNQVPLPCSVWKPLPSFYNSDFQTVRRDLFTGAPRNIVKAL